MAGYLELPRQQIAVAPIGINFDGLEPAPPAGPRPFTIGYLARIAPEKGLHLLASAYIRLRRELGLEDARLEVAGYLAPEHRTYLDGVRKALAAVGPRRRVPLPRDDRPAAQARVPAGASTCSRCRARTPSRRASTCSRRWRAACPWSSRGTEPSPSCIERTGGGVLFAPGDVRDLAGEAARAQERSGARGASSALRGSERVRRHYSAARMAERTLEICAEAQAAFRAA